MELAGYGDGVGDCSCVVLSACAFVILSSCPERVL